MTRGILGIGIQEGLLLKPVHYSWAYDLYNQAVDNTWFPHEIQLGEDLADFKKMSAEERHAVTFLMSYFNPNELMVNKAVAFGVYPYVNAAEAHIYLAKQMWEEANHCMAFEYVLETFPIDREAAYASHVTVPSMAAKEEFGVRYIKRMTEQTLDISTACRIMPRISSANSSVCRSSFSSSTVRIRLMPNLRCRLSSRTTQSIRDAKLRSRFRCRNDNATMKPE